MKAKLAIFDIDGTLTDSVKIHQSAFVKALNNFGLYMTLTLIGPPISITPTVIF
ncbi:MAG: hypothetical protein IPO70_00530 [Bacteroidetes bacterium]|nr:hypothetical protein [Bacteroidota bacterium]